MAFRTNAAPYQRAKRSTLQIMIELSIALLIVWLAAVVFTFISTPEFGVKSILMMIVALAVTAACDVVNTLLRHKKDSKTSLKDEILHDLVHNYSYVTAIIFTLTLPVWASYYVVIIGSVFATVVVKHFFGGFGKNIFNPAIMARIFVGLCFAASLNVSNSGLKHDSISGATITTQFNNATSWLSDLPLNNVSMTDLFLGNYFGSLGETFTILILVLGVVLVIRNVINWRTPVFYLGTVALTSLVIGLVCGFENPLTYVGYHIALGGVAFGAVFMLTDPVTGPTSNYGKALMAVLAGLLTVLIRVKGGYPEGVMYSIAVCNLLSPAVDYFTTGKTSSKLVVKYASVFGLVAVSIGLCSGISYSVNGGKEVYEINGIPFDVYAEMTETLGFDLKEGHELSLTHKSGSEAYAVIDAEDKKVASVYLMQGTEDIVIPDGHGAKFKMSVYVGINADGTIYDVAFAKGATGANWTNAVNNWANSNVVGNDAGTIAGADTSGSGATFSANALKELVAKAYGLYALDNLTTVGFELKQGHSVSSDVTGNETLAIVDASNNKVASVYLINNEEETVIPDGHGAKFKMSVYVGVGVDGTIYDVAFVKGATGNNWANAATTWADSNVVGKDSATIAGADAAGCGATFSANALKVAVEKAFELYRADNQGGNE